MRERREMSSYLEPYHFDDHLSYSFSPSPSTHPIPSPLPQDVEYNPQQQLSPYIVEHSPSTPTATPSCYPLSQENHVANYFMPINSFSPPIRVQKPLPIPVAIPATHHSLATYEGRQAIPRNRFASISGFTPQAGYPRIGLGGQHSLHKRNSSASSIGSVEPASPYTPTLASYPRIVDSDGQPFASHTYENFDFSSFQKPLPPVSSTTFHESLFSPAFQDYCPQTNDERHQIAMREAMGEALSESRQTAMTASSSAGPMGTYDEECETGFKAPPNTMPKLDRTMSDIYQDELYNPPALTSAPPRQPATPTTQSQLLSPKRDVFLDRLQKANQDHMSARSSSPVGTISRERSPFRLGSEHAPDGLPHSGSPGPGLNSSAKLREKQKAESDAIAFAQHNPSSNNVELEAPKTISPKEAYLELDNNINFGNISLIPEHSPVHHANGRFSLVKQESSQSDFGDDAIPQTSGSMATSRRESSSNYSATSTTGNARRIPSASIRKVPQVPQQYPFISLRQNSISKSATEQPPEFPANLTSMESTASDNVPKSSQEELEDPTRVERPVSTTADSGTYTCTYHGCTTRFPTSQKLQKHKRTFHRQSTPQASLSDAALAASRNSQAGPHRCERINPSTGKPCNSIFSRPYDLTRHEDTIHNGQKQKVSCQFCVEDKTFSRRDALSRHMRVVHPEVTWEGKAKRK